MFKSSYTFCIHLIVFFIMLLSLKIRTLKKSIKNLQDSFLHFFNLRKIYFYAEFYFLILKFFIILVVKSHVKINICKITLKHAF